MCTGDKRIGTDDAVFADLGVMHNLRPIPIKLCSPTVQLVKHRQNAQSSRPSPMVDSNTFISVYHHFSVSRTLLFCPNRSARCRRVSPAMPNHTPTLVSFDVHRFDDFPAESRDPACEGCLISGFLSCHWYSISNPYEKSASTKKLTH